MKNEKLHLAARGLLALQGLYFLATGAWPLVDLNGFLAVTGPKRDLWLVQTVGALISVIALTLLLGAWRRASAEALFLAVAAAASLATVDIVFVARHVIGPIYLLDAVAQLLLLLAWAGIAWWTWLAPPLAADAPLPGRDRFAGHMALTSTGR